MELQIYEDRTPEAYKRYVREVCPDKDELYLYFNTARMDLICEYLLFEEPDTYETRLGEILKYLGISAEDYNLYQKYSEAVRNVQAEVSEYNRYVTESKPDWPLLEIAVNKIATGTNQRSTWIGDLDAKIDYEEVNENEFGRLRTYMVIEKQRSDGA